VSDESIRLSITLPRISGEKLARMAARTHVRGGTLASSLLAQAIDEADLGARQVAALLDRIPGAWDRTEAGIADARAGRTVPLDEL
jgi:hypothetical protein